MYFDDSAGGGIVCVVYRVGTPPKSIRNMKEIIIGLVLFIPMVMFLAVVMGAWFGGKSVDRARNRS